MSPRKEKLQIRPSTKLNGKEVNIDKNISRSKMDCTVTSSTKKISKERKIVNTYPVIIVKTEFEYISSFFDAIEVTSLNHGKINKIDEDDERFDKTTVKEKAQLKKQGMKKGQTQISTKMKAFPHTIDGLEKELKKLKGKPKTYQQKLRKKGLHSRLVKKKRKEDIKQQKAATKLEKKRYSSVSNAPNKLIKPVLNSNGNVVSNKFDFAENKTKKENKRKLGSASNAIGQVSRLDGQTDINSGNSRDGNKSYFSISSVSSDINRTANLKKENEKNISQKVSDKPLIHEGPIFNKENKMVFSRVFLPENKRKPKKKAERDPQKILKKVKENSKKISELEKENKGKAASLKEKQKWASALKRASGEKVKDDPELLRKSIKREKNKKLQSTRKWQARIDRLQKDKDEREKKRSENILARKNEKKKKKFKKAIKKGSFVQT